MKRGENQMREYKVNITETVMRCIWVLADDPQDAIGIAEQTYSKQETLDVSFDVEPSEWREHH
ncbi:MAG: DpnD/PcfM family protein [Eubacteriales bacterium]|nr:DpnD/PcfM family protein [Eubacteriales bacterium]